MIRNHLQGALASVAVLLLSSGAVAQSSPSTTPAPAKDNAAAAAAAPKPSLFADAKGKGLDPAAKDADRAARLKAQHDAERQQLAGVLHAPLTDAMKLDLRQHAERVAKLERIRSLASDAKDTATIDRANKLLEKENARYEKWMGSLNVKTEPTADLKAKGGAQ